MSNSWLKALYGSRLWGDMSKLGIHGGNDDWAVNWRKSKMVNKQVDNRSIQGRENSISIVEGKNGQCEGGT